jgi:hypothetical protein
MVIDALYVKYFQKSKIFLYPLLGIKRGTSVTPSETYVTWEDKQISSEDKKLICVYPNRTDQEYKTFESNVLLNHNRLVDFIKIDSNTSVFIFSFDDIPDDWNHFMNGKYSKISEKTKRKILDFFDKRSGNYAYVESYLYPEKHFETYAKLLNVPSSLLIEVGELCNFPNLEKEKLMAKIADLENIQIIK